MAALVTGGVVYGISQFTDFDPSSPYLFIDPVAVQHRCRHCRLLSRPLPQGLLHRGRFGAFAVDLVHFAQALLSNMPTRVVLGGAGVFDALIVSGLIAVGLAEFVGETRSACKRG